MSETLVDTQTRLEAIIKENYPAADIGPGTVLSELVVKLSATLQNPITNDILTLGSANAISSALASATDTFNPIIDGIASNYNTVRNAGQLSTGFIKVIVDTDRTYSISSGFTFTQPALGLNYVTIADYSATSTPDITDSSELLLVSEGDLFYFVIPVQAANVGASYQVSDQTPFALVAGFNLPSFVSALAYGNFTSGLPLETDKDLITRFQSTLTNKTLLSTKSINARLFDEFVGFQDVSVVGANDAEMTRSKQNLFGISTLGMADVYVRSSFGAATKLVTKTATLSNNIWSFSLTSTDAAGFYRVISIIPSGANLVGSLLHTDTYGFSTLGISPCNVINNQQEARFTTYQTCNVIFTYDNAPANTTSINVDVLLAYQPNIDIIQSLFLTSSERIICADYLVKAAVPCYVTVSVLLHKKTPSTVLPISQIKQDIFNYINNIKFGENLYGSEIINICHKYDIKYVELPIKVTGDILTTAGTVLPINNSDVLEIPTNLGLGVSPKTTIFIIDYFKSDGSSVLTQNVLSDAISVEVV